MAVEGTKAFDGFATLCKQEAAIGEHAVDIEESHAHALCFQ